MSQTLSNCPFCSSKYLQVRNERRYFCVMCNGCGCSGPHRRQFNDAIEEWNALAYRVDLLRQHQAKDVPERRRQGVRG